MLIKSQRNLVPTETAAHSVVIAADDGDPLFVAVHVGDGIVYSAIGDKDFKDVLKLVGIETEMTIREIPPPPK